MRSAGDAVQEERKKEAETEKNGIFYKSPNETGIVFVESRELEHFRFHSIASRFRLLHFCVSVTHTKPFAMNDFFFANALLWNWIAFFLLYRNKSIRFT